MKVAFFTLGCKVNQYETDLMKKQFSDARYELVDEKQIADIYVVNSCSVTNLSTRKTRQTLSKAKKLGKIVILAGCYAQEIKEDEDLKNVDIIIGNEEKKEIVEIVEKYISKKNILKDSITDKVHKISDISKVEKYIQKDRLENGNRIRESVKIEDGCNNFCTYCIIPYVRGRVRSRSITDIVEEVTKLVENGLGEVVLVGIEIASYGKDLEAGVSLIDVIEHVAKIKDLKRIRLGSIEPRILTDENILRLKKIEKLCPHFHISVQSLDNNVLNRMNRHYTKEFLLDRIKKLRESLKDVAITCDIIVAFPGETKQEFLNTLNTVKEIGFYEVHIFKYSKRKWTKAANMGNQIDGNIANKRSEELIKIGCDLKHKYMKHYIGLKKSVLFESYLDGYLYGYTNNYIKVKVKGDKSLWGCQQEIELTSIEDDLMLGNIYH